MDNIDQSALFLRDKVLTTSRKGKRRIVAIAGAPASGKSTLAERLGTVLNEAGCPTQVIPMDGFHLDNSILINRDLLHRKGAPETFDVQGLCHLVSRIANDDDVYYPLFDRARDISIAGAGVISNACDTIVIEGNYLLLDDLNWRSLSGYWDMSIALNTSETELRQRLIQRWLDHGLSAAMAAARAEENDMPNARLILNKSLKPDISL